MAGAEGEDTGRTGAQSNRPPVASLKPKLTPRSTVKRLPWLDKKTIRVAPVAPLDGKGGSPNTSSRSSRPASRKTSVTPTPKRTATTTLAILRKPLATPGESRKLRPVGNSSSPIDQSGNPQNRRTSLTTKSPSLTGTVKRVSTSSRISQKKPSIVGPVSSGPGRNVPKDHRPIAHSLVPPLDQSKRNGLLETARVSSERDVVTDSPPAFISRVQTLPSQPAPDYNAYERIRTRRISNAVEDLEGMVQEAVEIADDITNQSQVEEIYEIIDEAKHTVQEVSSDPNRRLTRVNSPLGLSQSTHEVERLPESPSRISCGRNPPQPRRMPPHPPLNVSRSPGHANQQTNLAHFDWEYSDGVQRHNRSLNTSLSSSDHLNNQGRSTYSTQSDLLLPPQLAHTTARDHVDFVLRPRARENSHSRGRSRRRVTGDSTLDPHLPCSPRNHASDRSGSLPGHRRLRISESSQDESPDEEDNPHAQRNEDEVIARDAVHEHTFNLRRQHRRQPIARNWSTGKKRIAAAIACINTALLGIIIGVYAGEVPQIQYYLADERHIAIVGNVVMYFGLALSTIIAWPLPLLHGRKPYVLAALAIALPLQFPQAVVVGSRRSPNRAIFRTGLLCARAASGVVLGFANVNYVTVLLDLFGASLQSKNPHQEYVVANDVRRHGGGMGMWLGIWSWCWIGSLAIGFQVGAAMIESLSPDWGFYFAVIVLAAALILNIMAPETRRAPYRKSVTEVYDRDENYITRRVMRGEVKLHISTEGPMYWFEEVWAGMKLMAMMLCQPGFFVLAFYLAWIYAQIVLVIILLGALLSRNYKWRPRYVGLGVMSIALGALLAIPLTKAGVFSRERKKGFRTDSMTFEKQITWSSHLVRRAVFTLTLPLMGLAYTVSSTGAPRPYMVPIVFAGAVGFLSLLAIAECHGLIMETFDTCDLQPGVNTRHRFESMAVHDRRRRTNYSSFPRVTAGIFASQTLAFVGAALATTVGGSMTRRLGAQASTGVTAGILLGLSLLLTLVLLRVRAVQVIPNHTFGTRRDTAAWREFKDLERMGRAADWKAVVIGNPSGKMRRMSVLEMGALSRWTEIRQLNFLIKGARLGEERGERKRSRLLDGDSW